MRGGIYERLASSGRSARRSSRCSSNGATPSARSSRSTPTRCRWHGAYGVEAGARMYFNKSAKDVTLEEAATIAAIIQTPARLSPFVNPERTLARRNNYVLPRMAEEGFITRQARRGGSSEAARRCAGSRRPSGRSRRISSRRSARRSKQQFGGRRALRDRPRSADDARRRICSAPPTARSSAACGALDKRRGVYRKPRADRARRRPDARDASRPTAGRSRSPPGTSCPAVGDGGCRSGRAAGARPHRRHEARSAAQPRSRGRARPTRRDLFKVGDV